MSKIIVKHTQNKEFIEQFKIQLEVNEGFCPCRIIKTPDTKCMCKEFRDMISRGETGNCHCGYFIAEFKED